MGKTNEVGLVSQTGRCPNSQEVEHPSTEVVRRGEQPWIYPVFRSCLESPFQEPLTAQNRWIAQYWSEFLNRVPELLGARPGPEPFRRSQTAAPLSLRRAEPMDPQRFQTRPMKLTLLYPKCYGKPKQRPCSAWKPLVWVWCCALEAQSRK